MVGGSEYREYRVGSTRFWRFSGVGLVGMMVGLAQIAQAGAPPSVLFGVIAFMVLVIGLTYAAFRRGTTLANPKGITVQGLFRTRTVAWPDVQAIQVEGNVSAMIEPSHPREFVAVYDRTGRRLQLPHLNAKSVASVHTEVEALLALWARHRGEDWAPVPEAAAAVDRMRRRIDRSSAWIVGVSAAMASLAVCVVVFVILIIAAPDVLSGTMIAVGFGGVPVVVCGVAFTIALRRLDRLRPPSRTP
jgi:hypothetical protein